MKQRFFDHLDGEWSDLIGNTYKDNSILPFIGYQSDKKNKYAICNECCFFPHVFDEDTKLNLTNNYNNINTDFIASYIDYDKMIIASSTFLKNVLYIHLNSEYMYFIYKEHNENKKSDFSNVNYKLSIAHFIINENEIELSLFPLSTDGYIIEDFNNVNSDIKYITKIFSYNIKYNIDKDYLDIKTNTNIKLDKKFFEQLYCKIKDYNYFDYDTSFKLLYSKIEEKTDFFD